MSVWNVDTEDLLKRDAGWEITEWVFCGAGSIYEKYSEVIS